METKKEIRAGMRSRNRALTEAERLEAADRIAARLESDARFAAAHTVALFCSLPDEPPTERMLARWSGRKRIVVPRVGGETMEFFDYRPDGLADGAFGILEPQAGAPCSPAGIDLIVVPGVAFTPAVPGWDAAGAITTAICRFPDSGPRRSASATGIS